MSGSEQAARPHDARAPSLANAIDLFAGSWTTALPGFASGRIDLTNDGRILELERLCGGFSGKRVLEIGSLEGAHTYMLASRGASVTAIEADKNAYLRSLITKQLLGFDAEMLLGDALKYEGGPFDLVVCCGVLYHLMEPLVFLRRLGAMAPRLYIWTHFYLPKVRDHPVAGLHFRREPIMIDGVRHYPYDYAHALVRGDFSGGFEPGARWVEKDALLTALDGFDVTVFDENIDHPHGPALSIYAER